MYRPLYNATGLWVRQHAMFFEEFESESRLQPQFARISGEVYPKRVSRSGETLGRRAVRHAGAARENELVTLALMRLSFLSVVAFRLACLGDRRPGDVKLRLKLHQRRRQASEVITLA